jgi:uncharacterized MAPEG superfamily protein
MDQFSETLHQYLGETQLLAVAILLGFVQLAWAAVAARKQQGLAWARGARDEAKPVTGVAARLDRAFRNYLENFPFFAAALVANMALDNLGPLTWWGSLIFVAARIVYVPLYAAGTPGIRSLVWFVSIIGFLMVTAALFMTNGVP